MQSSEAQLNGRFVLHAPGTGPAPGKCIVCGSVERVVVDFGANAEFYGAILICVACMRDAMQAIGGNESNVAGPQAAVLSPLQTRKVMDYLDQLSAISTNLLNLLPDSVFEFADLDTTDSQESESVPDNEQGNSPEPGESSDPFAEPLSL